MTGTYTVACVTSSITSPANESVFGTVSADGVGMLTPTIGMNSGGASLTPPAAGTPFPYSVAADGAVNLDGITGGIRSDGSAAVAANVSAGGDPQICVLLRRDGTYSNATLTGDYHHGMYLSSSSPILSLYSTTAQGKVAFDGSGVVTYPGTTANQGGTLQPITGGTGSYALSAAGEFTVDALPDPALGGATSDGNFAIAAGSNTNAGTTFLAVYVKASTGLTASAFSGEYWVVGIFSDPTNTDQVTSFQGSVTADGAGGMNYVSTTENFEGAIAPNSGADTYTVGADGTLNSGPRTGAITADGNYAYLSGENVASGTPMLFVFIKK